MADTIRVRIAVAVDADGNWGAGGWNELDGGSIPDEDLEVTAREGLSDPIRVSFVEADVPMPPKPTTVEGETLYPFKPGDRIEFDAHIGENNESRAATLTGGVRDVDRDRVACVFDHDPKTVHVMEANRLRLAEVKP